MFICIIFIYFHLCPKPLRPDEPSPAPFLDPGLPKPPGAAKGAVASRPSARWGPVSVMRTGVKSHGDFLEKCDSLAK